MMIRNLSIVLLIAALALAVRGFLIHSGPRLSDPDGGVALGLGESQVPFAGETADQVRSPEVVVAPTIVPLSPEETDAPGARGAVEATASVPVVALEGRVVLTGLILGPAGEPLPGATVRLGARRRWSREGEATALVDFGLARAGGHVGFEAATDPEGRFLLDVPVPLGSRAELTASRGPFLSQGSVRFGKGKRDAAPLESGVRDLGEIQLSACGALGGVVVNDAGVPIQGSELTLAPKAKGGMRREIQPGADGAFSVGHLVPGEWTLQATAPEMIDGDPLVCQVLGGVEDSSIRIELRAAAVIRGRVVTVDSVPIAGAKVLATGTKGPSRRKSAQAKADDEGEFELWLPSAGDFDLVGQHPAYRPASPRSRRVSGTEDGVTIPMKPLARVHVTAVDGSTGEPLTEFGVKRIADGGSLARAPEYAQRSEPKVKKVADGYVEVVGRPGRDLLIVAAEGYTTQVADLAGAAWADGVTRPLNSPIPATIEDGQVFEQAVPMSRGGSIRGRVVSGDVPVEATISIALAPEDEDVFVTLQRRFKDLEVATEGDSGEFTAEDLAPGTYTVGIQAAEGALGLPRVAVRMNETRDLGDLEVASAGTITGQLELPEGVEPSSLTIKVVDVPGVGSAPVDESGAFRLERVPSGLRTITQGTLNAQFMDGGDMEVNVPAGGEVSVLMDLRDFGIVPVKLVIELDGAPLEGVEVKLVEETYWPRRMVLDLHEEHEAYLGRTDADGVLTAYGRAQGRMVPVLQFDGWAVIAHPTARIDLDPGVPVDEHLSFESSSATVVLPGGTRLPENGSLRLALVSKVDDRIRSNVTITFDGGGVDESFGVEFDESTGGWHMKHLMPGEWTVTALLYDQTIAPLRIGQPDAVCGTVSGPQSEFSADVTLSPGRSAVVRLK